MAKRREGAERVAVLRDAGLVVAALSGGSYSVAELVAYTGLREHRVRRALRGLAAAGWGVTTEPLARRPEGSMGPTPRVFSLSGPRLSSAC